jgi:hypothetical protein
MDKTPTSKLSCKRIKTKTEIKTEKNYGSDCLQTPVNMPSSNKSIQNDQEGDCSPIYFPLTQESSEDIDVLWDWHSPQTSQRKRRKQKRLLPVQSPKFPIKRYPSNNQNQNFEKLKNELKALQEELALPDDESCLCVSPLQETEIKEGQSNNLIIEQEPEHNCDISDLFNDSLDEQLALFSQKVEEDLLEKDETNGCKEETNHLPTNICDNIEIDNLIDKYTEKDKRPTDAALNDTFDSVLSNFHFEDCISSKATQLQHSKVVLKRTASNDSFNNSKQNIIQTASGKLEFHRTRSFELTGINRNIDDLTQTELEEIERKRLEALAKLKAKKKENMNNNVLGKCSLEEIEKKRLQALAKLEAKRLQDIVEKKRQEALKKLQVNRMKNASQVRSTLTKRL